MRVIHLFVSADEREQVSETLSELDVDYAVTSDGGADSHAMYQFPIPADGVRDILARLHDSGVHEENYTVISDAEAALTPNVDKLQERYAQDFTPLSSFSLRAKARSLSRDTYSFVWMIFLSAVIATAGLLIDSPAVVVGAMVIAPFVGPILTTGVGATTEDWRMAIDGLWLQVLGIVVSVVGSAVTAYTFKSLALVPATLAPASIELITLRLAPSAVAVVVGLAAGAAATFGITTEGPLSLIGVMIAAALIPAAGVVGIGIAWATPVIAVGTLLLLAVTVLAINVAMFVTLWVMDYRPTRSGLADYVSGDRMNTLVVTVAAIALVVSVGVVTAATAQQVGYQRTVNEQVQEVLGQDRYSDLQATSVTVQYAYPVGFTDRETVTVTVSRTADRSYPSLPSDLQQQIRAATDQNPVVRVRFVDYAQTNYSSSTSPANSSATASTSSPTLVAGITSTAAT
ncbi:DUF389 domain-containing protein [Haloprofundus halobius]|uniref:DUF389 domain-containing protein n=1 Tax=Haloprofundus halobius TaxID=2876194 RepID=UPI001CCD5BE8|nr:DUF389 domain-containing protein [Haloprofundus halobius]